MLNIQEGRHCQIGRPDDAKVVAAGRGDASCGVMLFLALIALVALVFPSVARSDGGRWTPIPADAVAPAPEELFRLFANHTEDWDRGSGKFWAPDGTWRAVNVSEKSIGNGTWYVTTASRVCSDGGWYWNQDFGVEKSDSKKVCMRFRKDVNGMMWSTTAGLNGPWFPYSFDAFERGNLIARSYVDTAAQIAAAQQ